MARKKKTVVQLLEVTIEASSAKSAKELIDALFKAAWEVSNASADERGRVWIAPVRDTPT